jgi:chitinase
VSLNLPPTSVSVSPDGLFAAVGHDAWISYVDLSTGTTVSTFPVSADVFDIVLAGNGYIYAFPRVDQWVQIHCIRIADGMETLSVSGNLYAGTRAKLHPSGSAIYTADPFTLSPSTLAKYNISAGTPSFLYYYPYWGDYSVWGDLWISEDGLRIFTKSGNVFRSSPNQYSSGTTPDDMTYSGKLSNLSTVRSLSHSAAAGKVVAIPDVYSSSADDEQLQWYNYDYLTFVSSVTLPIFTVGANTYAGHGRFVFYNSAGTKVYVLLQAEPASALLYDYGIVTY